MMNILLTGATGYIGGKLYHELKKDPAVHLRLLVRDQRKFLRGTLPSAEVVEGNTLDKNLIRQALRRIDVAYYLIHSMAAGADFEKLDRLSAWNFLEVAIEEKVRRIIYLGGLGNAATASRHLLSRIETGEILSSRPQNIQAIWLRAGIIIGAGSASFEIIRHLVHKIPVMTTPRWVRTMTQPISVHDVIRYLVEAKGIEVTRNLMVDIGSERMTFKEMLLGTARVMGLRRHIIAVPLLTPRLSSLWLILFAPVPYRIARALVDGLKSETVITNANARKFFPQIRPLPFEKAVELALAGA
jgi:uncharacterized protein YbjT (DUF2867 family)